MKLLLDTHALLWFLTGDPRIPDSVRVRIESSENMILVSVATIWEMAIKHSLGKLHLEQPFDVLFPGTLEQNGMTVLSVEVKHAAVVAKLPFHHRDPFDRLLVAQCVTEGLSLLSADSHLDAYGIERLW